MDRDNIASVYGQFSYKYIIQATPTLVVSFRVSPFFMKAFSVVCTSFREAASRGCNGNVKIKFNPKPLRSASRNSNHQKEELVRNSERQLAIGTKHLDVFGVKSRSFQCEDGDAANVHTRKSILNPGTSNQIWIELHFSRLI